MPARRKPSSFIRYCDAKVTFIRSIVHVSYGLLKPLNQMLDPFLNWHTVWLIDWYSNRLTLLCACMRGASIYYVLYRQNFYSIALCLCMYVCIPSCWGWMHCLPGPQVTSSCGVLMVPSACVRSSTCLPGNTSPSGRTEAGTRWASYVHVHTYIVHIALHSNTTSMYNAHAEGLIWVCVTRANWACNWRCSVPNKHP